VKFIIIIIIAIIIIVVAIIIIILYYNRIFLRIFYFQFAELGGSAEHHLGNTRMKNPKAGARKCP
jgi:hypothetical protein